MPQESHDYTHRLHNTDLERNGTSACATVVYLQPKEVRWPEQTADAHSVCTAWLDLQASPAIYRMLENPGTGVHSYIIEGDLWRFLGTFDATLFNPS